MLIQKPSGEVTVYIIVSYRLMLSVIVHCGKRLRILAARSSRPRDVAGFETMLARKP